MTRATPRPRRARLPLLLASILALVLLAGACGSSSESVAGSSPGGTVAPRKLVLGLARQFSGLDPGNGGSPDSDGNIYQSVYSSLTVRDPKEELVGDLATSWSQTSDLEWEFKLRPGVVFSDGKPLDSSVVVWNIKRVLDPANKLSQGAPLALIIADVTAPDATTVKISTKKPYLDLPRRVTNIYFLQPDFVASHNPKTDVLGSGPYVATKIDLERGITLAPNPKWYGAKPIYTDVEFRVLADEASRVSALKAGEVDLALQLNPEDLDQFKDSEKYEVGLESSPWLMTLRINETKAPFDKLEVRQALNYAIDKEAIAKSVLRGSVQPSPGQLSVEPFDKIDPSIKAFPYDPEKAKSLLEAAGVAEGLNVDIELSTGTYVGQDAIVQVIASQLEKVGIKLNIKQAPFPTWVEKTRTADVAPLIYIGFGNYNGSSVENLTYYAKPYSQVWYDDKPFEELVVKAKAATSEAEQEKLIFEAQKIFHDNAHAVYLFPQPLTYVVAKDLQWTPRGAHWIRPLDITPGAAS